MRDRLRVVVGGYLGLLRAGGVTWDYLQYPLGLAELGCDVFYVEDTRLWPVYAAGDGTVEASANVAHLAAAMKAFGLAERWAYRDEVSGECFGMPLPRVHEVCATADLLINVSCSTVMRDEYASIPVRALIDSDPMFTQIQCETAISFTAGESNLRALLQSHTHHLTYGESQGLPGCRMPSCGVTWQATRQPIVLRHWPLPDEPAREDAAYTTVMNWSAVPPLRWNGETWGQKNVELLRLLGLPRRVPALRLAIAVGQTQGDPFPAEAARRQGWSIEDPARCAGDWKTYRRFLQRSRGELSVAKETYVKGCTGWFSGRSACYLASGRPVVAQDTGWTAHLPSGAGLLAFTDEEEAVDALSRVEADWAMHARAARRVAEEHFHSDRVLGDLLRAVGF
ncbi:MAG TPA: hypothetical protein VNA04_07115 [Thermoanaerobaculia bacterium]|nr:hypothetical protein [Thermoanaerobaculia bacterium]